MRALLLLFAGFALLISVDCSVKEAPAPPPPQAHIDVAGVVARARYAYRDEGDRLVASTPAYEVRVEGRGGAFAIADRTGRAGVMSFETRSIARGGRELAREATARVDERGRVAIDRGGAVETLEDSPAGVEEAWSIASRPEGEGDLVVRVSASGLPFSSSSRSGLHFGQRAGVSYGAATWIDAHGQSVPVATTFDEGGGSIELRVPSSVIDAATYPARIDPMIGLEFGVDNAVYGPIDGSEERPAVAFDGTNYLVVWSGPITRATRITPAGTVLDPKGLIIRSSSSFDPVRVASNGSEFLVTWSRYSASLDHEVWAARIDSQGNVLDPNGFVVAQKAGTDESSSSVGSLGADFLVAYSDGGAIVAKRISAAGAILDANPIALAKSGALPSVSSNGGEYLVAWQSGPDILANGVTKTGFLASGIPITVGSSIGGTSVRPSVAFNGLDYLVAWEDDTPNFQPVLRGERVDAGYNLLDMAPFTIALGSSTPVAAASGTDFLVGFDTPQAGKLVAQGKRIDANGVPDAAASTYSSPNFINHDAAIAGAPGGYLFAFGDFESNPGWKTIATRLDNTGAALDPNGIDLGTSANGELEPRVASDGTNYLVVWTDRRNGEPESDVRGSLVTPSGTLITPDGFAIADGAGQQDEPAVAGNAAGYLVAWRDIGNGYTIRATLVDPMGNVADKTGVQVGGAGADQLDVATNGTDFLVVFRDYQQNTEEDIFGARVSAQGQVLDPGKGIAIGVTQDLDWSPRAASNGTDYLVVWESVANNLKDSDVLGARVSAAGKLLDATPLQIATGGSRAYEPSVASNGKSYFAAWGVSLGFGNGGRVDGAVIDAGGGQASLIVANTEQGESVAVATDRDGYGVTWRAYTGGTLPELHARWFTGFGAPVEAAPVVVEADHDPLDTMSLASSGKGTWLIAYYELVTDPAFAAARVEARVLQEDVSGAANGAPCPAAGGSACASGFCSDGVCCDTVCGGGSTLDCQACSVKKGAAVDGTCAPLAAGTTCRKAKDQCDAAETCDGSSGACPADAKQPDHAACDDGNACTLGDACIGGACVSGAMKSCPVVDSECGTASCDPMMGCVAEPYPDGTPCLGGACANGSCQPSMPESGASSGGDQSANDSSSGCGCRVAGEPESSRSESATLAAIAAMAAISTLRRRRSSSRR